MHADRWGLELEATAVRGRGGGLVVVGSGVVVSGWAGGRESGRFHRGLVRRESRRPGRHGLASDVGIVPWGVGRGLGFELGEVEVRACLVAGVHGLPEFVLRVEAVEDDGVNSDGDEFDNDLDDAADQTPVLQAADECVVDVVLEEFFALVVLARPAPHVLAAAGGFGPVENARGDEPHDGGEGEVADGEDGVVHGGFCGSAVARAPVGGDDDDGEDQGDDGDG